MIILFAATVIICFMFGYSLGYIHGLFRSYNIFDLAEEPTPTNPQCDAVSQRRG